MKKKTVITTEKREVWVIRRGSVEGREQEESNEPDLNAESALAVLKELNPDKDARDDDADDR